MTSYVMHREVCLKHRKNRREISCGCERELAAVFVLFVVGGAGTHTRAALTRPTGNIGGSRLF